MILKIYKKNLKMATNAQSEGFYTSKATNILGKKKSNVNMVTSSTQLNKPVKRLHDVEKNKENLRVLIQRRILIEEKFSKWIIINNLHKNEEIIKNLQKNMKSISLIDYLFM